ncbi:hypothetical protein, partial [Brevibacterium aurantiacum]|uniref:hypothetical protein n=1 Tax=Brevibacterium aurantiacum TaxID=273384 RepID=UPI00196A53BB
KKNSLYQTRGLTVNLDSGTFATVATRTTFPHRKTNAFDPDHRSVTTKQWRPLTGKEVAPTPPPTH